MAALTGWTPPSLPPLDPGVGEAARRIVDGKAKPPGALGLLEDLAVQLSLIQGRTDPRIEAATALVFAGDHGMTADGVSAFPREVTAAMVGLFLSGRASVSAFAAAVGVEVQVFDVGVAAYLPARPGLVDCKVAWGTRNAAVEPAMTPDECARALDHGLAAGRAAAERHDVIALGEMGIGNTASAALLMHRLAPAPLVDCIGLGAGHDAEGLARKRSVLERAAARCDATSPFEVLCEFGGFEIAAMAGAALGAAERRRPVLVDGFIASTAVLAAIRMQPALAPYCIFAHASAERGHALLLELLGVGPLLQLDMRLGEGTGAVLAVPLLRAAARLMTDVASLAEVVGS
jgi:nicotinate-nucleotide--dimethylbenzimidazole phosphoribosyltransferase